MSEPKILYVCASCWDQDREVCGWSDRSELRCSPSGRFSCEDCFDEEHEDTWPDRREGPPEYVPAARITELEAENAKLRTERDEAQSKVEEMKASCRSIGDEHGNFTCPGADVLAYWKERAERLEGQLVEARNKALDEAAAWHDAQSEDLINHVKTGVSGHVASAAAVLCDAHRRYAKAILALKTPAALAQGEKT